MINMSTELFRVNFIDADNMLATIAVFKSFDDFKEEKDAIFYHETSLIKRESTELFFDACLTEEMTEIFQNLFNVNYVLEDCVYEQAIAYRDNIRLDSHKNFKQAVFYFEFQTKDLTV